MNLQKIMLCVAAGLTAFGASFGGLEIARWIGAVGEPLKIELIKPELRAAPVVYPKLPIPDFKPPAVQSPETSSSEEVCEFNETGDYGFVDENPKGFEEFESLNIVTEVYTEKYPNGIAVKPQGTLQSSRGALKFTRINITGKRVSIVTETKKGVTYLFDGKFVKDKIRDRQSDGEEYESVDLLKGRLTKKVDGKKVAETRSKFVQMCGC